MNKNNNSRLTLGAHVRRTRARINRLEKAIGPIATALLVVGVVTIFNGYIIVAISVFSICLLLCLLKINFLRKRRQSSFVWAFNLVITIFFLAITFIDWKLKI
ncbi:MAG: hypothetical protein HY931_03850 [Candidatus Falkowbacteria bacterium]|nr:MAG: hypothetical protein HY931_03850 [Candidatus Falkowbacteria bacterium]